MFGKKNNKLQQSDLEKAVKDLNKGSAEAFHLLYQQYNQKVYRFCLRMLEDTNNAQDAFQEIFIKVFEHRNEFRGGNFSAWLFTIARHTCLNYLRKRKDFEELEKALQIPEPIKESDIGVKDYIKQAISKLPLNLKEALILREYEDCSYQEIADILGIDLSLAKVRVHRARLILRKLLKPIVKELYES